jgi:hypothetical protein
MDCMIPLKMKNRGVSRLDGDTIFHLVFRCYFFFRPESAARSAASLALAVQRKMGRNSMIR